MSRSPTNARTLAHVLEPLIAARYPVHLPSEYRYAHLSLTLIDAIFSLGAQYESTRATVLRYAHATGLTPFRTSVDAWPSPAEQQPVDALLTQYRERGLEVMRAEVLNNRQRTSTHASAITKAEAVCQAAELLVAYQVHYFQDLPKIRDNPAFAHDFRTIPGQTPGTGLAYWWMLTGSDRHIKPDRMVIRLMESALGRQGLSPQDAQCLAEDALSLLKPRFPTLTLRQMDYVMWTDERNRHAPTRNR